MPIHPIFEDVLDRHFNTRYATEHENDWREEDARERYARQGRCPYCGWKNCRCGYEWEAEEDGQD